ncbi:hypothetical protein B0H10DRAFT_2427931 [Mycena sp. CBHHK59/15]|nr:hypothetical protein B0H10DRAFT_2427931 [Mycena sp. CBHHK59/15]
MSTTHESIPATALAAPAHLLGDTGTPTISHEALKYRRTLSTRGLLNALAALHTRVSWALEYGTHTSDPMRVLADDSLLLVPHPDIVRKAWDRVLMADPEVPNELTENMYNGSRTFHYVILPLDPSSPIPPRILTSKIPPHLAIASTSRKFLQHWEHRTGYEFDAAWHSLAVLCQTFDSVDLTAMPTLRTFQNIIYMHETWTDGAYVPPSFLGLEEESPCLKNKDQGCTYVVVKNIYEPQRRLLPCEGGTPDPRCPLNSHVPACGHAGSSDDDAISWDSHIPDADELEEYVKASIAHGDYAADAK